MPPKRCATNKPEPSPPDSKKARGRATNTNTSSRNADVRPGPPMEHQQGTTGDNTEDQGSEDVASITPDAGAAEDAEANSSDVPSLIGQDTRTRNILTLNSQTEDVGPILVTNRSAETAGIGPQTAPYVSPLERYRQIRAGEAAQSANVSTVEGLLRFIQANDVNLASVRARLRITAKVVWTSTHIVKTVDQLLITATIFGCTADSPGIPPDGAIVTITNPSKIGLFMDKACQLTTRLANFHFS
ncbi:hypothetical protein F443_08435 [Phytophthora nicotianae P1569]|uniref:Uncharacterized protein n=1 Tax=Phytophthora nicotianae P1569 TaxID=1317065 RepID=V9F999_PHYNI|nr:hypothetical protein F443_08435 [Phytophthora nicotianae P1569]